MAVKILGSDIFIRLGPVGSSFGGAVIGYCNRGLTINLSTEMNEVTQVDIDSVAFLPTFKNCTIEAGFVLVEDADSGNFDFTDITDWWEDSEPLVFLISYDINSTTKVFQGECYITSISANGNYNEVGSYNVSLQATGEITIAVGTMELAYWGWADTDDLPTEVEILALQGSGSFLTSETITADFTANSEPKFLIMAERITNTEKTVWYGSAINTGPIGASELFYNAGTVVAGSGANWRVYITSYLTQQEDTTIQFRVS